MLHAYVSHAGLQQPVLWLPGSASTVNGLEAAANAGKTTCTAMLTLRSLWKLQQVGRGHGWLHPDRAFAEAPLSIWPQPASACA